MNSNKTIIPAFLVMCFVLGGCGGASRKAINPMTGMIDVTAWRVLETGDIPGDNFNIGCRLTNAHIQDYISELQWRSSIYGNNTRFIWNGSIFNIPDVLLPNSVVADRTQSELFIVSPDNPMWQSIFFDDNAVNIYFVGNIQVGGDTNGTRYAATLDPGVPGAFDANSYPAFIYVNDGGREADFGFFSSQHTPQVYMGLHILEHEMTHYLDRVQNRTFGTGPGSRTYDSNGHIDQSANNILRAFAPFGSPLPLVIPGQTTQQDTELFEIWNRIFSGLWNSP
jgi:hypothetical protein